MVATNSFVENLNLLYIRLDFRRVFPNCPTVIPDSGSARAAFAALWLDFSSVCLDFGTVSRHRGSVASNCLDVFADFGTVRSDFRDVDPDFGSVRDWREPVFMELEAGFVSVLPTNGRHDASRLI